MNLSRLSGLLCLVAAVAGHASQACAGVSPAVNGDVFAGYAGFTGDRLSGVVSIDARVPATLAFYADGTRVGSYAAGVWGAFSATIDVEPVTAVVLRVEGADLTVGGAGFGSNDIARTAALPEPSGWAMLGLGFACIAFSGYRSRRASISIV